MHTQFHYNTLLYTKEASKLIIKEYKELTHSLEIQSHMAFSMMDSLDYLMDHSVDIIIVDLSINKEDAVQFLEYLSDDYENKATPTMLIADPKECQKLKEKFLHFNILSVAPKEDWPLYVQKLLSFLRAQKLQLHLINNSLVASEDRGIVDQLTGAFNRYGCEDVFHKLTARFKAYAEPFCMIMSDIDHFKSVNDTYGHDVGDEVLIAFSKTIMSSIRESDSLIRQGGEEFVIFLSNVELPRAKIIAESLRNKIENNIYSSQNLKITSSFGVVEYRENEEFANLFKRVDELIYTAKSSGRNIVISEDSH